MADDEPIISTTVPETTTVQTGVDKETLGNINQEFEDFWKEQDSDAPAAPGEGGAAQETKEPKPEKRDGLAEPKQEFTKPAAEPKEYTDEEIDALALSPAAKPEASERFKEVRELWKQDRAKLKAEAERIAKLEQELTEARKNIWSEEARADYEHAASIRRRFDLASDPEFVARYEHPIRSQYQAILQEAVEALPDREAAQAWAEHMFQNYKPDQLSREWWQQKVLSKVPDEIDRQSLLSSVTEMIKLQRERDGTIARNSSSKDAYEQWTNERNQLFQQRTQNELKNEIAIQEQALKDYLPRNVDEAKTREEREAIEAHNERFNELNNYFTGMIKEISAGPRGWVRAGVEACRAQLLDKEYKTLEADYKSACAERDKYKQELDRITGVRRKMSHTSGTPPAAAGKKDGGLSLKDLDVRKSFEKFDWGEGT